MRERTRGHLLSIVCTLWCAGLLHVDARTQQTFVVRYKNGEHTVPVTVVLDYKKQTEYVINMSPRAATKTVTLYDFKQKTIAYKDLTNRECFLGHLTHETLNEETDALTRIHSPVDRQPKVLSLDPHRSSLTPTEIRNMAGQKTAVFCGKMNTWLVLPREAHSIQKREVDEIDERTFHRHGYHTVRYSHFGRETRRRYRNPASRHQGRTDGSKVPSWKRENLESATESSSNPLEYTSFQQQWLNPSPLETAFNGNNRDFHRPEPPVINEQEELHLAPTFRPASNAANWNSEKTVSSASQPNGLNNEYEGKFPFYSTVIHTGDKSNDGTDSQGIHFANLEDTNMINGTFAEEKESSVSKSKPYLEITENNHESSQPNSENRTDLNGDHSQNRVEDESIPFGYDSNVNQRKHYPKFSSEDVVLEDPDVSTNVLEIPKTTKKFENIDNSLQPPSITQTDEDVHDVFEGFFNLRKRDPPSKHLPQNSYFIPPEPNGRREHNYPDESLINSNPFFSLTKLNNDTNKKQKWGANESEISKISEVIAFTDFPSITTNAYSNFNGPTISPTYWDGFSDSRALKSKPENSDKLNSIPQKVAHSSRSRTDESLQSASSKEENILNKAFNEYFTTVNPLYASTNKKYPYQWSDILGENITETIETFKSSNLDQNIKETNKRLNLLHSGVSEGTSSQQIRFQNVLRNYKPDEIIIDVEKIPTQRPPESTLDFKKGQVYSPYSHIFPNLSRSVYGPKSEQTSGDTWRGTPILKPNSAIRKSHNLQPGSSSFASRIPPQLRHNESNLFQRRVKNNNIRHLTYPSPQALPHPLYSTQRSFKLDSLPPGVSIHPRHPKAPYAEAVRSNLVPPVTQGRTPKLHHLRHHKKKDRLVNSCCRTRGKTKSCCGSCCRSKSLHSKPSCCSSTKPGKNELRPKQVLSANAPTLQHVRKPAEDPRNRCQKEKLCRTLYESTQQVMVCRHAEIEGC